MARPISENQKQAAALITSYMTEHPEASRKEMLAVLLDQLKLSPSNAAYYLDRACRHLFFSLRATQPQSDVEQVVEETTDQDVASAEEVEDNQSSVD
jgi:hypothetical protein